MASSVADTSVEGELGGEPVKIDKRELGLDSSTSSSAPAAHVQNGESKTSSGASMAAGGSGNPSNVVERRKESNAEAQSKGSNSNASPNGASRQVADIPPTMDVSGEGLAVMDGGGVEARIVEEKVWKDVEGVTVKAQELTKNVVEIAASTAKSSAVAVQELGSSVSGITQIGSTLSSWWNSFDPLGEKAFKEELMMKAEEGEAGGAQASDNNKGSTQSPSKASQSPSARSSGTPPQASINVQAVFGLPANENLIEALSCKLSQIYRCHHNSFTREMRKVFKGRLYITDKFVCFHLEDGERGRIPVKFEHSAVSSVMKLKIRRGTEKADQLKISLGPEQWVSLEDFPTVQDLKSAFAMLEHLSTST
eukprot:TRINITY_DN2919_c0_g2_i1.p1 TRINITY_DN2919_c0_g2~~TRINITY_DN2919_c0_g2_i1.p1  ORF type:complete len:366 (+),score=67.45 TRINITY_DN2919_c0_g2_i1:1-1098(+)